MLFEILNEPAPKFTHDSWHEYWKPALALIRASNPNRTVILGPAMWNGVGQLEHLKLPDDDRNIIATVHYYNPFPFTHQGTPWTMQKDKLGVALVGNGCRVEGHGRGLFQGRRLVQTEPETHLHGRIRNLREGGHGFPGCLDVPCRAAVREAGMELGVLAVLG